MALSDILEALTLGGAGAIRGYQSAQEEERARQERERARMDELRYRQQQLDMRERELAESRARDLRQEEREMGRLGYRVAGQDEPTGPMTFRPRDVKIPEFDFDRAELARPQTIPAPRVEGGRVAGTGAAAAPEQTYSAVARALEDYKGPEVRPAARERTYEGPEISIEAPERRGFERVEAGDRTYLRPDEELLKKIDTEREEAKKEEAVADKAKSIFDAFGGDISMEQAEAIARSGADPSNFVLTPYQRASLARQREGDLNINTLRNRIDTMIRRGKDDVVYNRMGDPKEVNVPYSPEEIINLVEEQARLYERDPSDLYPDYDMILQRLNENLRTPEDVQGARARFDASRDLNGFNVGDNQSLLIDPDMEKELELMFDQSAMTPRLNEMTAGQRRANRNFATDNYFTRGAT